MTSSLSIPFRTLSKFLSLSPSMVWDAGVGCQANADSFYRSASFSSQDTAACSSTSCAENFQDMSNLVAFRAGLYDNEVIQDMVLEFEERFPNSIRQVTVGTLPLPQSNHSAPEILVVLIELHDAEAFFEELIQFFFQGHCVSSSQNASTRRPILNSYIFFGDERQLSTILQVRAETQERQGDSDLVLSPHLSPLRGFKPRDD